MLGAPLMLSNLYSSFMKFEVNCGSQSEITLKRIPNHQNMCVLKRRAIPMAVTCVVVGHKTFILV
jgi:hypothetical protein